MVITQQLLASFKFTHSHNCVPNAETAKFMPVAQQKPGTVPSRAPMVYVWLVPVDGGYHVLYAGKAGSGVSVRLKQHEGGFVNSVTGRKNLQRILALFAEGKTLEVHARVSGFYEDFLGVTVSLYSTEEQAIIDAWEPELNRAGVVAQRDARLGLGQEMVTAVHCEGGGFTLGDQIYFDGVFGDSAVSDFYESITSTCRGDFLRLLKWALSLASAKSAAFKVVKGYTRQPKGYNGVPTLLVSELGKAGIAKRDKWLVRIPLVCEESALLTVVLPKRTLLLAAGDKDIECGMDTNFRPRSLGDFLGNPGKYTSLN